MSVEVKPQARKVPARSATVRAYPDRDVPRNTLIIPQFAYVLPARTRIEARQPELWFQMAWRDVATLTKDPESLSQPEFQEHPFLVR